MYKKKFEIYYRMYKKITYIMSSNCITRVEPFVPTPIGKRQKCRKYPFYYYYSCNRKQLEILKLDKHKIAKILGNKWRRLSDLEKEPYIRECNKS